MRSTKWVGIAIALAVTMGSCTEPLCGCTPARLVAVGNWRGAAAWPDGTIAPESLTVALTQVGESVSGAGAAYSGAASRPVTVAGRAGLYQLDVELTITGWRGAPSRFIGLAAVRPDSLVGTLESPSGEHQPLPFTLVRARP